MINEENKKTKEKSDKKTLLQKIQKVCIVFGLFLIIGGGILFIKPKVSTLIYSQIRGTQGNARDCDKDQIKVIIDHINIRELALVDSDNLGKVNKGDIYTVIDMVEDEKYEWFMIETKSGIIGYIASAKESPYVAKMFLKEV